MINLVKFQIFRFDKPSIVLAIRKNIKKFCLNLAKDEQFEGLFFILYLQISHLE